MANRPFGRQKNVTGQGSHVGRRGEGLGTGPVGNSGGYQGRPGSQNSGHRKNVFYNTGSSSSDSGTTRGFGGKGLIAIVIIAVLLLGGGGISGLFGNLFGGSTTATPTAQQSQSGSFSLPDLSSLSGLGDLFGGSSTVSSDWTADKNTGKLNTNVASSARAKRTVIYGDGSDQVTIMVYLCGTDLESKSGMASNDLQEMCSATLNSKVNVLVYTGGCKSWKNSFVSSSKNQIYKIENGGMRCLVKDDGNAAMTKPATLTGFINYCTKNYPANRYELILWDHGGGSISGYGYDEKNASAGSMTLSGINQALKNANTTFDFIGFDTCLMATAENALMLTNYADYMIASEETEPGIGWYYTNWLTKLGSDTSMPTAEIGKMIADDFVSACNKRCPGQKTTLSVIDLAEFANTVPSDLGAFADSVSRLLTEKEYKTVSDARYHTREFAPDSKIDQVDLVDLALKMNTDEGRALADSIRGAVKYSRNSSNMTNAYGVSIYFPYQRTSYVDTACSTYDRIDMDDSYGKCIRQFASLETSGQIAAGGSSSPLDSLFGGTSGGSSGSAEIIGQLLSGFLGGGRSIDGLDSSNTAYMKDNPLSEEETADYLAANYFSADSLIWQHEGDTYKIILSDAQWETIHRLDKNMFYDDGTGYVDLGLDNVFTFDDSGDLIADTDRDWLAVNGQPVAYYHTDTIQNGDEYTISGYIPAMLNDERVKLLVAFDNAHPDGRIIGAQTDYHTDDLHPAAKNMTELQSGDKLDFLCDYYSYSGEYLDSYYLGEPLTVTGDLKLSNVDVGDGAVLITYCFTDIYNREYWSEAIKN